MGRNHFLRSPRPRVILPSSGTLTNTINRQFAQLFPLQPVQGIKVFVGEQIGFELTTLGIDATIGEKQVGTDLNETGIIDLLESHDGPFSLLLSPMGGQGFLIGRGNLQLSPKVLRIIGIDNIMGVVTPAKLLTVRLLRIDTGDEELDTEFSSKRYLKVLQGYRTTRILPVSVD